MAESLADMVFGFLEEEEECASENSGCDGGWASGGEDVSDAVDGTAMARVFWESQDQLFKYPLKNQKTCAAEMVVGLKTGVPWVMCKQDDAPDPVDQLLQEALMQSGSTEAKIWVNVEEAARKMRADGAGACNCAGCGAGGNECRWGCGLRGIVEWL